MAFWTNWFKSRNVTISVNPGRIGITAVGVTTLITLAALTYAGIKDHNQLQNEQLVKLWNNHDAVKVTLNYAKQLISSHSATPDDVAFVTERLDSIKPYFNPALFTPSELNRLRAAGAIWDEKTMNELKSMNEVYTRVVSDVRIMQTALEKIARKEQEKMVSERSGQGSLRN